MESFSNRFLPNFNIPAVISSFPGAALFFFTSGAFFISDLLSSSLHTLF